MSDVIAGGRDSAVHRPRSAAPRSPSTREGNRIVAYDAIVRFSIRHEYYGADNSVPFVTVVPTSATQESLHRLGFLFRSEPNGCVILGNTARRPKDSTGVDVWLTFLVNVIDKHFGVVSDIHMNVHGRTHCAYVTNHADPEEARPAAAVRAVLAFQALRILPRSLVEPIQPGETFAIHDRAGRVLSLEWPANAVAPIASDGVLHCDPVARRLNVDLSTLPERRYSFRSNGRIVREGLRLAGARVPAAFVELHLPEAAGNSENAGASDAAMPTGVEYEVMFGARRTIWKYSIVPRSGSGPLDNLIIDTAVNGSTSSDVATTRFLGPFEEALPNGARVYQFLSNAPIALRRRSPVRLRLSGRRKDRMTRDGVLVECLPVPGRDQLAMLTERDVDRLGGGEDLRNEPFCSEMFVYV